MRICKVIFIVLILAGVGLHFGYAAALGTEAAKKDAVAYDVTFYRVNYAGLDTMPVFLPGNVVEISWTQPLGETSYNKQPDPQVGDRTGEKYTVRIGEHIVAINDTQKQMIYEIQLNPGYWEVAVAALDAAGNRSKESNPALIRIKSGVPMVPVKVFVKLKK